MNTVPQLVARALRDRQRITYSYINASNGFAFTYGRHMSRSGILRDVRNADLTQYRFGVYLDVSRDKRTLNDYRIEPPHQPVKPVECIDLQLHTMALERIQGGITALTKYDKPLADHLKKAINDYTSRT
jgi:hypothetical protein